MCHLKYSVQSFTVFQLWITFDVFFNCLLCRRGNKQFDVQFRRFGPVPFVSRDARDTAYERRKGWKGVHFHRSRHCPAVNN